MGRIKLYYPLDEITSNLYTSGKQWMTTDDVEYIGLYHTYTTGEVYTEASWDSKLSKQLIVYKEKLPETEKNVVYQKLMSSLNLKFLTPKSIPIQLRKTDIYAGSIRRYFIKKYNEQSIIEIDSLQYEQWQNNIIDTKMYNAVNLIWYINGNINDVYINGVLVEGVSTKNKKQVILAAAKMPELQLFLTNYTEYYSDNTFIIPADINGLDS